MTFAPTIVYGALAITTAPYAVEFGFNLGSPDTQWSAIESVMYDGSVVDSPGDANRTINLSVIVEGTTSGVNATAWAALMREVRKPFNTLTFTPGDGVGNAVVIDTYLAKVTYDYDQDLEQMGLRRYILTIPAMPNVRSSTLRTINWTGPLTQKSTVTVTNPGGGSNRAATFVADNYLRLYRTAPGSTVGATSMAINTGSGPVTVPTATILIRVDASGNSVAWVPTHAYRGQSITATWQDALAPTGAHTVGYPYPNSGAPKGVGVLDLLGTMRARCTITFTVPAGGAELYVGPDPDFDLRERGAPELMHGWNTSNDIVTYDESTLAPLEANPTGVWPRLSLSSGFLTSSVLAIPTNSKAAVLIFNTTGVKTIVSGGPRSPGGYRSDAIAQGEVMMHAPRCGFGLVTSAGASINATITYYDTFDHFPA